ncbi:hypothetical protein Cni_G10413 [Canna indica]|uniref:Transmembrane protein n=1 Tax=Canna indica TaxID=4628 RepID=A0AAQ3Q9V6_9LILI|nr:hypothetical protein Cni_G10413 [Canna indica]
MSDLGSITSTPTSPKFSATRYWFNSWAVSHQHQLPPNLCHPPRSSNTSPPPAEARPSPPTMAKAMKTLRRSFRAFFRSSHSFTATAALLVFPVSAATLLAHSLALSSPALHAISSRLAFLFEAAGFPLSQFFSLLTSKLSQTLFTSAAALPFALTFLVLAKASVFLIIHGSTPARRSAMPSISSLLRLYPPLALTHLLNSLFILSANAAVLSLLFLAFNVLSVLHLATSAAVLAVSASGVILYSFVLANAAVACNLATVISAADDSGGHVSILKALVLVRERTATAVTLSLPASMGTVAIEALFRYRVMRPHRTPSGALHPLVICEAFPIIYMHSLLLVLDTIIACIFLRSCRPSCDEYALDRESVEKNLWV